MVREEERRKGGILVGLWDDNFSKEIGYHRGSIDDAHGQQFLRDQHLVLGTVFPEGEDRLNDGSAFLEGFVIFPENVYGALNGNQEVRQGRKAKMQDGFGK